MITSTSEPVGIFLSPSRVSPSVKFIMQGLFLSPPRARAQSSLSSLEIFRSAEASEVARSGKATAMAVTIFFRFMRDLLGPARPVSRCQRREINDGLVPPNSSGILRAYGLRLPYRRAHRPLCSPQVP